MEYNRFCKRVTVFVTEDVKAKTDALLEKTKWTDQRFYRNILFNFLQKHHQTLDKKIDV